MFGSSVSVCAVQCSSAEYNFTGLAQLLVVELACQCGRVCGVPDGQTWLEMFIDVADVDVLMAEKNKPFNFDQLVGLICQGLGDLGLPSLTWKHPRNILGTREIYARHLYRPIIGPHPVYA